jgi:hypothetical protein
MPTTAAPRRRRRRRRNFATARTLVAKREQKMAAAFHEVIDKEQVGDKEEAGGEVGEERCGSDSGN